MRWRQNTCSAVGCPVLPLVFAPGVESGADARLANAAPAVGGAGFEAKPAKLVVPARRDHQGII